jgi:putative membrane protein
MMWWDDGGWSAAGWLLMVLMMVVFWRDHPGGLAGSERQQRHPLPSDGAPPVTADQVLAARFARGEIDEDEFRRRHAALHPRG